MTIKSVEDLHEFLKKERNSSGRGRAGDKTLAVLADMLNRPGFAAVDSISTIAAHNKVDPSTLTRLGKRLGFSGFSELQDIFRLHVMHTQPFYSGRVQERVAELGQVSVPESMQHHAQAECQKLLSVAREIDPEVIEKAVEQLVAAKHVYVLGLRATYALSYFFGSYLGILRENVTILGGPGYPFSSDLARINKDDLLVAISFRPYTRMVVTAVDLIKENGTPTLVITDTNSPFKSSSEQDVTITLDQPFYFDSATAQFFAIETLLLATAKRQGSTAVEMTKRRERIAQALEVEIN